MHTNQLIFDIIKYLLGTFKQKYFGLTSIRTLEVGTYIKILSWDHTWDIITDLLGSYNQFIWDILLYLLEKQIKYWLGHTNNNVHTKDMLTYLLKALTTLLGHANLLTLQALTTLLGHANILTTGTNHFVGTCKPTYNDMKVGMSSIYRKQDILFLQVQISYIRPHRRIWTNKYVFHISKNNILGFSY